MLLAMAAVIFFTSRGNAVSETSRQNYQLMSGVTESTVYVTDSKNENIRVHLMRINKGANISLKVSTANYYKSGSTKSTRTAAWSANNKSIWGFRNVAGQIKNYEASSDKAGSVVAGINGDFYMLPREDNGMTIGNLVMEGNAVRKATNEPYFAVLKDGSYAMRDGSVPTDDVEEAISGFDWLLKDGKIMDKDGGEIYPSIAIGLTYDGTVVMACIPAKSMTSKGTTLYNMDKLLQQQGCKDAIMLDGGGSASFLTKRSGDKAPVYRNDPFGSIPRAVSSAIMVVKNSKAGGGAITGQSVVTMKSSKTKLTKAKNGTYSYKANGKVRKGFVNVNGQPFLFDKKGKGMTKKFTVGDSVIQYQKGIIKKIGKKKPGVVGIGTCGKDLIFAYQYKKGQLDIGVDPLKKKKSGKMEEWKNVMGPPWVIEKYNIKSVVAGEGVKNIGSNFMVIPENPFDTDSKNLKSSLKSVKLSKTVTSIGARAFFNHFKMKAVNVPEKVKKIGDKAFYANNGTTFTFEGSKPPKMGKASFTKNKKSKKKATFKVKKTKQWKKYLNKKNKKKIGFSGKVKFMK